MPRTVPTVQHRRWGRLPMNTSTTCYFDNWEDPSHPSPSLESYAREQPSFNLILVEQLPQPFLNAGRSVFAQEFEHQAVERLHANLNRLVAHPQHVALNALHVVHYAKPTREFPRLCRGGSKSLTYPEVGSFGPWTGPKTVSRQAHERSPANG